MIAVNRIGWVIIGVALYGHFGLLGILADHNLGDIAALVVFVGKEHKSTLIALAKLFDVDIVNIAIVVEIQVVYPRFIQGFFQGFTVFGFAHQSRQLAEVQTITHIIGHHRNILVLFGAIGVFFFFAFASSQNI